MKAKIRKTEEIVDVMSFKSSEGCPEKDWVCYVDSEGLEHTQKLNALRDLEVFSVLFITSRSRRALSFCVCSSPSEST